MKKWKNNFPEHNWLMDLDYYRIKNVEDRPENHKLKGWDWPGPWYSGNGEDGILAYLFEYIKPNSNGYYSEEVFLQHMNKILS